MGGSWVGAAFKPGEQHKRLLDKVAPNNPVLLDDESLHSIWVNSRALEIAGITRNTKDPAGGVIDRDSNGEPIGILREIASRDIEKFLPPVSVADQEAAIKAATDEMLSLGIVGFADASVRTESIEGMMSFAKSGGLKQYARGCIVWGPNSGGSENLIPARNSYAVGRLQLDCVKMFLDGVPLEGRTAAMLEPYVATKGNGHAHGNNKGMLLIETAKLNAAVAEFDRQGINVKFHAAGDGATRQAADAIAFARNANGAIGPKHDIGHNTFVDPADVSRGRTTPFTWELSPYIWWPTPITSVDIAAAVGPERMKRLWPMRDVLDSGANVVIGSDWPVVPSANPWIAIETLVSRQVPGATGEPINAGQRITRQEAIDIMTRNGAAHMGRLDRGGTIEVGKIADFIIIDRNPLTAPLGDIHKTKVLKTFIAGEEVYSAKGSFE
jgi:predicted amidohydrolase YtcJ